MLRKIITLIKPPLLSVIIFDGKMMQYKQLTQRQINKIKNDPECQDWIITIQEEEKQC